MKQEASVFNSSNHASVHPVTEKQLNHAKWLGIDISGLSFDSARVALNKVIRDDEKRFISLHHIVPGMVCMLDNLVSCSIIQISNELREDGVGKSICIYKHGPGKLPLWVFYTRLSKFQSLKKK